MKATLSDMVTEDDFSSALSKRPTKVDVDDMIRSHIEAVVYPTMEDNTAALRNHTETVNMQLANINDWLQTVRNEQQRQDAKQDQIEHELTAARMEQTRQDMSHKELVDDIFGKDGREETGSLIAHFDRSFTAMAEQMGKLAQGTQTAMQPIKEDTQAIRKDVETIKVDVAINTKFRERRQKIERLLIQTTPKAAKQAIGVALGWLTSRPRAIAGGAAIGMVIKFIQDNLI